MDEHYIPDFAMSLSDISFITSVHPENRKDANCAGVTVTWDLGQRAILPNMSRFRRII